MKLYNQKLLVLAFVWEIITVCLNSVLELRDFSLFCNYKNIVFSKWEKRKHILKLYF